MCAFIQYLGGQVHEVLTPALGHLIQSQFSSSFFPIAADDKVLQTIDPTRYDTRHVRHVHFL